MFPNLAALVCVVLGRFAVTKVSAFALSPYRILLRGGASSRQAESCRGRKSRGSAAIPLWGIAEWRDFDYGLPGSEPQIGVDAPNRGPPKPACILPFPFQDVLLQGETKQLRLYEDRFIKLFDDVMENHEGVVAMGLIASSGVIQTVPLCEVEAYNRMAGFGIFVTIRVVGRAQLLEISQQEPYIKATCAEISDKLPPNLELPNLLAGNIENYMLLLSSMEHRLKQARENNGAEDKEMERRIAIAKLEDRCYASGQTDGDKGRGDDNREQTSKDEDSGDEEEEEGGENSMDRLNRFRRGYEVALSTDTQGYRVSSKAGNNTLSPRELTAISWAAFSTETFSGEDAFYRIQALDSENLFERLKLGFKMLQEKKARLRSKMEKAGIKFRRDDPDAGETTSKADA